MTSRVSEEPWLANLCSASRIVEAPDDRGRLTDFPQIWFGEVGGIGGTERGHLAALSAMRGSVTDLRFRSATSARRALYGQMKSICSAARMSGTR